MPKASSLLSLLSHGHAVDASTVCVVVAHPDDESIGCGGQLARLAGVCVVLATDGAPRNLVDAEACGFDTAGEYARVRAAEFQNAMRMVGVDPSDIVMLCIPDQCAARNLDLLTRQFVEIISRRDIRIVITHAYEGGHPDHDAVAFCVHAARDLLAREARLVEIIEMPLYRLEGEGMLTQSFSSMPEAGPETCIRLSPSAQHEKRRLLDIYQTQRSMLSMFKLDVERFRLAPRYDFATLPNAGRVLYEGHAWGLSGAEWIGLTQISLRQLARAA
jgi:LmbE family N-acetylglucosaminyl deacetylase